MGLRSAFLVLTFSFFFSVYSASALDCSLFTCENGYSPSDIEGLIERCEHYLSIATNDSLGVGACKTRLEINLNTCPGTLAYVRKYSLEQEGAMLIDTGSDGINATAVGAVSVPGLEGAARQFDGTHRIEAAGLELYGSSLSASIFVYPDQLTGEPRIFSQSTGIQEADHAFMVGLINGGFLRVRLKTSTGTDTFISSHRLQVGQWQHVAVVYDGAELVLYVAGQEVDRFTKTGTLNISNNTPIVLGDNLNNGGYQQGFYGKLDEFQVTESVLTASEIQQLAAPPYAMLSLSPPDDFTVYASEGEQAPQASKAYHILNSGSEPLEFAIEENSSFFSISSGLTSGTLEPGQELGFRALLDQSVIAQLPAGVHQGTLRVVNITNDIGSVELNVSVTIYPEGSGLGDRPGPQNTGPFAPSLLQTVGSMTITQPGAIIENVRVQGTIIVQAPNVTIRNFIVDTGYNGSNPGGTQYGIKTFDNANVVIEDGEIKNVSSSGILGNNFTARRLNIHDSGGDAIKVQGDNSTVESCWLHHLGIAPGAHADGVQMRVGSVFRMVGNNCDMPINAGQPYKSNACAIIQTGDGPIDDVVIENNWLNGGNFTVYLQDKGATNASLPQYGPVTNARVINNRFLRDYRYGTLSQNGGSPLISGNIWDDTEELMDINNQ